MTQNQLEIITIKNPQKHTEIHLDPQDFDDFDEFLEITLRNLAPNDQNDLIYESESYSLWIKDQKLDPDLWEYLSLTPHEQQIYDEYTYAVGLNPGQSLQERLEEAQEALAYEGAWDDYVHDILDEDLGSDHPFRNYIDFDLYSQDLGYDHVVTDNFVFRN